MGWRGEISSPDLRGGEETSNGKPPTEEAGVTAGDKVTVEAVQKQGNVTGELSPQADL